MSSLIIRAVLMLALTALLIKYGNQEKGNITGSILVAVVSVIFTAAIDVSVLFINIDVSDGVYLVISMIINVLDALIPFIALSVILKLLYYRAGKRIPVFVLSLSILVIVTLSYMQIMGMIVAMKAAEAGNFLDAFTSGYDQRKMGIIMIIAKILPIIVLSALKVRSSEKWERNETL